MPLIARRSCSSSVLSNVVLIHSTPIPLIIKDSRGEFDFNFKCKHVNFVTHTNVGGEEEYLFSPYSTFTVRLVRWSDNPTASNPHVIEIDAAIDNSDEPEDLPLSPWY